MDKEELASFRKSIENHVILEEGTRISANEARILIKAIRENEFSCIARLKLIGYFFEKMMYQFSRDAAEKRQEHVL